MDLVEKVFDGPTAPFVALLCEQHLDMAATQVVEADRKGVDADALDGSRLPLQGVLREQRPTADQGPARDIGIARLFR